MPDDDEPHDLRGIDVARILHCDESQVYRYAQAGRLPYRKTVGGQRRYRRSDAEALAAGLDAATGEATPTVDERLARIEADVADLKAWRERTERPPGD